MPAQYYLPCSCGQKTVVSTAQAGQTLRCACGAALEAPTLRGLSQLEPAPAAPAAEKRSSWGPRQGVMLLALAVAAVSLGAAAWFWQRSRPAVLLTAQEAQEMERLTPVESWRAWRMLSAHGLHLGQDAAAIDQARFSGHWVRVALGVAAVAGAAFLLCLAWPLAFGGARPR